MTEKYTPNPLNMEDINPELRKLIPDDDWVELLAAAKLLHAQAEKTAKNPNMQEESVILRKYFDKLAAAVRKK